MPKHQPQRFTLAELVRSIDPRNTEEWFEIIGIEIPGREEAIKLDDDGEVAYSIGQAYLAAHANDVYQVTWPEHVHFPSINSDASYSLVHWAPMED